MESFLNESKYQDLDLIYRISNAYSALSRDFGVWTKEGIQNFKKLSGYILSEADKRKLRREGRPDFEYNMFMPIVLSILGNQKASRSMIEAEPRNIAAEPHADIFTKTLQYFLYDENDFDYEFAKATLDALVARIGWVRNKWVNNEEGGTYELSRHLWAQIKFDPNIQKRNTTDMDFLSNSLWFTPEGLLDLVKDDPELYEETERRITWYLPPSYQKKAAFARFYERIMGESVNYLGKDQGFDASMPKVLEYSEEEWYKSEVGMFNVIEWHEKRNHKKWLMQSHLDGEMFDITNAIQAQGSKYDSELMSKVQQMYPDTTIMPKYETKHHKTTICPALRLALRDKPYDIQTGKMEYTPVFCYDFGLEAMDHKSLIDHISDPVSAYNKQRNTMLEHLMQLQGETWVEESALGEYKDAFMVKKPGATKILKNGAISGGKVKRVQPSSFSPGLAQMLAKEQEDMEYIGQRPPNTTGTTERSGESGKLFTAKVEQSDLMQEWLNDNINAPQVQCGEWCRDMIQENLTMDRIIPIAQEGGRDWLYLNYNTIIGVLNPVNQGKYKIRISKAPYGKFAKEKAFEMKLLVDQQLMNLNPLYIDPVALVESAPEYPRKTKQIARIKLIDAQMQEMQNQQQMMDQQNSELETADKGEGIRSKQLQNKQTESEISGQVNQGANV